VDLEQLVAQIKERGTIIKEPRRLRRKPRKDITEEARRVAKAKYKQALKRIYMASIAGTWKELRKSYRNQQKRRIESGKEPLASMEWNISLEDWKRMWEAAGTIGLPGGGRIEAFKLRGRQKGDLRVYRIDYKKSWELKNMAVIYQGRGIVDGRKL
jgi:hypothetical protein